MSVAAADASGGDVLIPQEVVAAVLAAGTTTHTVATVPMRAPI